jgi:hypothetical protein
MGRRMLKFLPLFIVGAIVFVFIGGQIVMHLWNWLLPSLFGWKQLTFWQALGMLLLCRILFGGFGGGRGRGAKYTPEQKERFRAWVHGRRSMEPTGGSQTS